MLKKKKFISCKIKSGEDAYVVAHTYKNLYESEVQVFGDYKCSTYLLSMVSLDYIFKISDSSISGFPIDSIVNGNLSFEQGDFTKALRSYLVFKKSYDELKGLCKMYQGHTIVGGIPDHHRLAYKQKSEITPVFQYMVINYTKCKYIREGKPLI
jgi:hypothetical protein